MDEIERQCPFTPFPSLSAAPALSSATGIWLRGLSALQKGWEEQRQGEEKGDPSHREGLTKQQPPMVFKCRTLSLKLNPATFLWPQGGYFTSVCLNFPNYKMVNNIIDLMWLLWGILTINNALKIGPRVWSGLNLWYIFMWTQGTETPKPGPREAWQSTRLAMLWACLLSKKHLVEFGSKYNQMR